VGPTAVTGADAVRAWRALTAQQRAAAWAAAKANAAPPDGALAAVMAGYGLRRQRQLQFAPLAVVVVYPALLCGVLVGLNVGDVPQVAIVAATVASMALVIGLLIANMLLRQRFGRLAAAGALGLEAAHRGAVPVGVPVPVAHAGDFTVPYGVPAAPATFGPPAAPIAPIAPGVVELPAQRKRVAVALALFSCMLLFLIALLTAALLSGLDVPHDPAVWVFIAIEAAGLLFVILGLGVMIALLIPTLRHPVSTRFTPQGWELVASKMRGPWSEVQAIEVRSFYAGGAVYRRPPSTRIVVLRVPQPERYLAGVGPLRRWALGRSMKRYGSPVLLATGARTPVNLEQLLATLAQYTAAPVRWT
jgi:hypothetical protein